MIKSTLRLFPRLSIPGALLLVCASAHAASDWVSLFDGRTLDHWVVKGGTAKYHVEGGVIVGTTSSDPGMNTFLSTKRDYADFELYLDVRCDNALNSGIQIRSHVYEKDEPQSSNPNRVRKKGEVYGYQCEIAANDKCTSGNFWDEGRWTKWHDDLTKKPGACAAYRAGEWNHFRIVAQGDRIRSWVNGVPCADFREGTDTTGFIGLQVHRIRSGAERKLQVRFKNIRIRELKADDVVN
jgi:hypothetical protein